MSTRQPAEHRRLSAVRWPNSPAETSTPSSPLWVSVIIGVPAQEKGIRPARALPYELDVHASVNASNSTVVLTFFNTGSATVVFQVRSGNAADPVRTYTVEPGKTLAGYVERCLVL